jgi:hypothetical protein
MLAKKRICPNLRGCKMRNSKNILTLVIVLSNVVLLASIIEGIAFDSNSTQTCVIGITCVCLVATCICAFCKTEHKRRVEIRTTLVGKSVMFNPETGVIVLSADNNQVDVLQSILCHLTYKLPPQEGPTSWQMKYFHTVVVTDKFRRKGKVWVGSVRQVCDTPPDVVIGFSSKEELCLLLQ